MDGLCGKCGTELAAPGKFCPNCGTAAAHEIHLHAEPPEHEKAPVENAFSGLLFGVILTPMMLIVGTMLCLTGLGAILGIPMIVGGILAPLMGPVIGFNAPKGKCPWCDSPVSSLRSGQSFECEACHKRIAFKDERFVAAA